MTEALRSRFIGSAMGTYPSNDDMAECYRLDRY